MKLCDIVNNRIRVFMRVHTEFRSLLAIRLRQGTVYCDGHYARLNRRFSFVYHFSTGKLEYEDNEKAVDMTHIHVDEREMSRILIQPEMMKIFMQRVFTDVVNDMDGFTFSANDFRSGLDSVEDRYSELEKEGKV